MKQCVRMTVDVFVARYQDAKLPQKGALTLSSLHRITWTNKTKHPFNGPLSETTRVRWYQKGETNRDITEARGSEWQWHQLGHMQVCTSLQTDNYARTPPLSFLQAGCPSCRPTNSVKALKATITWTLLQIYCRSFQWKSFENRLRVDRIMATSLLGIELNQRPCGWPSRHIIIVIISIHLSANNSTNIL